MFKLYYLDPWLQELQTTVTASRQGENCHLVALAETIFYPTGGGQPHDLGSINGQPLLDVFEEDGVIFHVLAEPLDKQDAFCVLDWARRLDHMQQHSGQHLLSAIFAEEYKYHTESFHLGAEYCSIDISTPVLPSQKQEAVERRVNQIIFDNLPILTYTLTPEEVKKAPLRKIPDLEGDLRIVEIEGLDYSPCAGTHVHSTSQIGLLKLLKAEKYKGMTRVYFLCGHRALRDYHRKHNLCTTLGGLLSVPEGDLPERLRLEMQQRRDLEKRMAEIQAELVGFQAQAVVSQGESPFFLDLPNGTIEEAGRLARAILDLTTSSVVITLADRLVLAHNLPSTLNLGQLVKDMALPLGGRGGGSPFSAQVYFSDPAQMAEFRGFLQNSLPQV